MLISWALVWVLFGHPGTTGNAVHDPPKTCEQWCDTEQCQCYDRCGDTYLTRKPACTSGCNKRKENCKIDCYTKKPAVTK